MAVLRENWLEATLGLDLKNTQLGICFGANTSGPSGQEFNWRPTDSLLNLISDSLYKEEDGQVVGLMRILFGLTSVVLNNN